MISSADPPESHSEQSDNADSSEHLQEDLRVSGIASRIRDRLGGQAPAVFARENGIPSSTIDSVLRGTIPRADNALRIARALGCSVDWLLTGKNAGLPSTADAARSEVQALRERKSPPFDPVSRPRPMLPKDEPTAYDRAALTLDEAIRIISWEPPESIRRSLMPILFAHRIDAALVAYLLEAVRDELFDD